MQDADKLSVQGIKSKTQLIDAVTVFAGSREIEEIAVLSSQ